MKPPKTRRQNTNESRLRSKEITPIASISGLIVGFGILDKAIGLYLYVETMIYTSAANPKMTQGRKSIT